ncbi:hypothetical protein E2C01_022699 [Portunus trituberculatus]|uniref:Uncharacterized protein n=1 Tax=Portunus trituberculatus TaxID=210409 RepID=A0A5B7E9J6_PORTR|nr:hypothetical protein [Portunus trituberculatus]
MTAHGPPLVCIKAVLSSPLKIKPAKDIPCWHITGVRQKPQSQSCKFSPKRCGRAALKCQLVRRLGSLLVQTHTQAIRTCLGIQEHSTLTIRCSCATKRRPNMSEAAGSLTAAARHQPRLPCDHLANNSGLMFGPHTSCDTSWMDSDTSLGRSVIING